MRPPVLFSTLVAALTAASVPSVVGSAPSGAPPEEARLLRYPDVSRTQITFVKGGDIYVVAREGGTAQRLTSAPGMELYPKFSPDGAWIAYSAEYSGTRQVYVIPAAGGTPRQLTWYSDMGELPVRGGTDNRVLDWTPDGRSIVVRMNRLPYDDRGGRPYLVPFAGGMEVPMVVPETGGGGLSPDGTRFVYTPIDADWRGWKRYRGGRAPDVWVYDLRKNTSVQLTTFRGMDQNPAWIGDEVYFASDRTGTLNLYTMPATAANEATPPRPLTTFTDFDVLWSSGGPDAVVFEQGGWIWRYDVGAATAVRVPIRVIDDAPSALPHFVKVTDHIESFGVSPDGARAVFGARGEVYTVPARNGEPRNVSRTPGIREHSVSWSPDGLSLAWLSDASGEYEIWVRAQDGSGEPRRVTRDGTTWKLPPVWSPDGQRLAFADKDGRLRVVDVVTGVVNDVDRASIEDLGGYTWSPDSAWLAYTKVNTTRMQSIWVWSRASGKTAQLTSDLANETSPVFDPEGRYLYFLSNRDYTGLTFSAYEESYLYTNATRIYAATLSADAPPLNALRSDEVGQATQAESDGSDAAAGDAGTARGKKGAKKPQGKHTDAGMNTPEKLRLDIAGFDARVVALDVPAGSYFGLTASADAVYFLSGADDVPTLKMLSITPDTEPQDVAGGVSAYALSADGKKLLVHGADAWSIVDAAPDQDLSSGELAIEDLELRVDPRVEWAQMYTDAWRIVRDWFYDPGVHGGLSRWVTVRDRYAALVPHVTTPEDLNVILHELAGEANAGHVYVERAAPATVNRTPGGLLGADIVADASGYFRLARIYPGENWDDANRSPLTAPGVNVKEGEYVIAVDGVDARTVQNVYQLLDGKANRVVELTVNTRPTTVGARMERVRTIANEQNLRYLAWVHERRAMVDRLSEGRIGYLHLPNTAQEGNRELNRWLPVVASKDALIIDDRWNGGGFIPDRMIELLARTPLNYWKRRGLEPQPTPGLGHRGPKVMLINGLSSSGGDALPFYFRELKLGTLIGTRTWGGLIGLSGNPSLVDGSAILTPTFRFMDPQGQWAVENEGVAPDIEVVDRPELVAAGRDPSVEKAVEVLLAELARNPPRPVVAPPAPSEFR